MTDHIPADKVRKLAARFRQQMEPHTPAAECEVWECAAEAVEALLPPPSLPTLADMTEEERAACQWMQADAAECNTRYVIANPDDGDGEVALIAADGRIEWIFPECVTPRPDLPRLEWPGDKKPDPAPAPALPGRWRLADHKDHGRVIVTTTEPDREGDIYFVYQPSDGSGSNTRWCKPADLTYIDTTPEEA